ncbi:hypothetical protein JW826_01350 [Candidatus Woesearchaeota archaeon]|nr:hypothetical protein [Candidatus Woesearchaeota archaeon]
MVSVSKRSVLVLDGSNYVGKSEAMSPLMEVFSGATVIAHHGCYRLPVLRSLGDDAPVTDFSIRYSKVPGETLKNTRRSHLERLFESVRLADACQGHDVLIERLHPSDYVYWGMIARGCGLRNGVSDYSRLEEELNRMGAVLVMLTLSDEALRQRMRADSRTERKGGPSEALTPLWNSLDFNLRKRDLYEQFYDESGMAQKMMIDTSVHCPEQVAQMIISSLR